MDDSLPFDFWLVKINEKTQSAARGSQIVKALGRVFAGKTLHTFQFDHQLKESRTQGVRHLKNSSEHLLGQFVEASAFIGVHQRPINLKYGSPSRFLKMKLAADQRG